MLSNQNPSEMNLAQLHNVALNVVEGVSSVVSMPVEIILRPFYGTRYFQPPVLFLSAMMMVFLPIASLFATAVTQMLPIPGFHPPAGLFGLGSLSKLYFLLSFVHGIRLWRRIVDMSRETNSTYEGPPLPFFRLFPYGDRFWITRIIVEPAFVFLVATVLGRIYIFQSGLTVYLQTAALALALKQFVTYFRIWEYLRDLMDARYSAPLIARMIDNRATDEDLNTLHLASFPKNVPPDIRQAAVSNIARTFSPDAAQ